MTNTETVIRMTENFTRSNAEDMLDFFTDDCVWNMVGNVVLSGKDQIRNMMNGLAFNGAPDFKTGQVFEAGDQVVLTNRVNATLENGEPFKRQWCNIYRFSGGKIRYIESYPVDLPDEYLDAARKQNVLL